MTATSLGNSSLHGNQYAIETIIDFARSELAAGKSAEAVCASLTGMGLEGALANEIVGLVDGRPAPHALRRPGARQMLGGAALCAAGAVSSALIAGSGAAHDVHVVMTGMIGVGVVTFFLGLFEVAAPTR